MSRLQDLKEKKLLYSVSVKKDPQAFGELYDFYIEKIFRFVLFKLSNREEAEDLTSEVFLKAWQYLISENANKVTNFNAFIYRIARNSVIDVYRQRAKKSECPIDTISHSLTEGGSTEALTNITKKQDIDDIFKGLGRLKQEYQDIILLKYIEELSTKEIAQILEKSQASVRVTMHRAIKVLKKVINDN